MKNKAPEVDYSKMDKVAIEAACPCSAMPVAHLHALDSRISAVRRWNRESSHKLKEPTYAGK